MAKQRKILSIVVELLVFLVVLSTVVAGWRYAAMWVDSQVSAAIGNESVFALRGVFGDKFGAVNALFSGLAFAGIILTILLQRRDLAETRRSSDTQRFNDTFFQLLGLHLNITEKLSTLQSNGREAFVVFNEWLKQADAEFPVFAALQKLEKPEIRQIRNNLTASIGAYPSLDAADVANIVQSLAAGVATIDNYLDEDTVMHERQIAAAYTKVAGRHIDDFSHYFRNLYHILKFIDDSELISADEKRHYSRIVRAQLSDVELVAIFYNSVTKIVLPGRPNMELGCPKMNKLLAKFDVLQNISPRSLFHPIHYRIFEKNAGAK